MNFLSLATYFFGFHTKPSYTQKALFGKIEAQLFHFVIKLVVEINLYFVESTPSKDVAANNIFTNYAAFLHIPGSGGGVKKFE